MTNPIFGRTALAVALATAAFVAAPAAAAPPVATTLNSNTYTQDFNTLAASGTGTTTPAGWGFEETGANANSTYTAGTGSSNAGDTYSFGIANGNTDRAFGTLRSGNLIPFIGAIFTNGLGASITDLAISYAGEQYRLGTAGRADRLDFQYSLNATNLQNGNWIDVDSLDFASVITTGSVGQVFGTAPVAGTIGGLNIGNGASFAIRFLDFDATGADDALAIDDFRLVATTAGATAPVPEPATWAMMIAGFSLVGGALRSRSRQSAIA
jgi:hypothetical protein